MNHKAEMTTIDGVIAHRDQINDALEVWGFHKPQIVVPIEQAERRNLYLVVTPTREGVADELLAADLTQLLNCVVFVLETDQVNNNFTGKFYSFEDKLELEREFTGVKFQLPFEQKEDNSNKFISDFIREAHTEVQKRKLGENAQNSRKLVRLDSPEKLSSSAPASSSDNSPQSSGSNSPHNVTPGK